MKESRLGNRVQADKRRESIKLLRRKGAKFLLLIVLSFVLTTTFQKWVGDMTIYSPEIEETRLQLHAAILNHELPSGFEQWKVFITRTNTRVFTVYLADKVSKLTNLSIHRTYRFIDTISLFFIFILLYIYLRKWFSDAYCIIGILYLGCTLVLTYLFYIYHPWDRLSLLSWIVLLLLLRHNNLIIFALMLAFSVTIKFDVVLLPALYWLTMVSRDNWRKTTLITLGLFIVSFGALAILHMALPGGEPVTEREINFILFIAKSNYHDILSRNIRSYPPFLVFLVPTILALYQLRNRERFIFSSAIFGFALLMVFSLWTNFLEVRAQMPVLVLILPAALMSLRNLLETPSDSSSAIGL